MVMCNMSGLIALVRRAAVVVGGDSGPVHLAAALGAPVVALFGPTDPARNGPWGAGPVRVLRDAASVTSYKRSAETEAGLARISVEEVVDVVREMSVSR
jgi:heptosyltransferase-1